MTGTETMSPREGGGGGRRPAHLRGAKTGVTGTEGRCHPGRVERRQRSAPCSPERHRDRGDWDRGAMSPWEGGEQAEGSTLLT